jgi:diguanylate cyclase (GGDEF)-like protein
MLRVFFPSLNNSPLWPVHVPHPAAPNSSRWRRLFNQRWLPIDRGLAPLAPPHLNPDRYPDRQAAVATLGQRALDGASLAELFQTTAQIVAESLQVPVCRIWQVLSDGNTLRPVALADTRNVSHPNALGMMQAISMLAQPWSAELLNATQPLYFTAAHFAAASETAAAETVETIPSPLYHLAPVGLSNGVALLIQGHPNSHGQQQPLALLEIYGFADPVVNAAGLEFAQAIGQLLASAIERYRTEGLLQIQSQILEQVASGATLTAIFNNLCLLVEAQSPGCKCSILQLDETGEFIVPAAAPSMPPEWMASLDGQPIGEYAGSCGTSLHRQKPVIVADISTDPLWENCRDFALDRNIRSMWSTPFFSQEGEVLGTFGIAHPTPSLPTPFHHQLIKTVTHLATIAAESRRTANQLQRQALYDGLTGLPNRIFFMRYLAEQLQAPEQPFALLFLDVDHFKLVNDSMGHNAGDQLLIAITQRLKPCIRRTDTFSRLGGDEFAIVLEGVTSAEQAQSIADQIKAVLSLPFKIFDREVFASVSIGISHSDNFYSTPEEILRDADIAMYRAKALGRSQSATFDKMMHENILDRMQVEMELRRVVDQLFLDGTSQLQLHYQPIVSLSTGRIVGFEALIRWMHPDRGTISPLDFIPIAEETGLIVPIGQWVLQEACQQLRQWQERLGMPDLMMSVNVSSRQFLQADFLPGIEQMLDYTKIPPACLKLEITESVLMEAAKTVTDRLERLREMGIRLSLDDFGTGYSSLSYLHQFPINTLKVDRSFVNNLAHDQDQVVQAIVALTHGLDMDAVAEGIETLGQLKHLKMLGCEYGQGYLFSPPVNRDVAGQMLQDNPQWLSGQEFRNKTSDDVKTTDDLITPSENISE